MSLVSTMMLRLFLLLAVLQLALSSPDGHHIFFNPQCLAVITTALLIVTEPEAFGEQHGMDDDEPPPLKKRRSNDNGINHIERQRRPVKSIFHELGPTYTRRSYRMSAPSFWKLLKILEPQLQVEASEKPMFNTVKGAKNGLIPHEIRLSSALRYFAGGRPDDICLVHGISPVEVYRSVWKVVDAINTTEALAIVFPEDEEQQRALAKGFKELSDPGIACCVGAIDGLLIWTEQPTERDCLKAEVGPKKFMCGRKKKFGLNLQGTCDYKGQFLDISIGHPASTSDYLAFSTSSLYYKLENGLLAPGFCLFGDNVYVNTNYMATPFKSVRAGTKDDYNFYHSQLRIKVECSFGMLVNRVGILRKAIPASIGIQKTVALVMSLCRLHNYCINEREASLPALAMDNADICVNGGFAEQQGATGLPDDLNHNGEHFADVPRTERRQATYRGRKNAVEGILPRDRLWTLVEDSGMKRPLPLQWDDA